MKKYLMLVAALLFSGAAFAQSVQQSGSVTPNTVPAWNSSGVIKGGVTATDSPVTNFGVTRDGADGICVSSGRQTAVGRNTLCLQASTAGPAKIVLQNYGTATAQDLQFVVNGNVVTIPTGGESFLQLSGVAISGHMPCFSGTAGLVVDCGVGTASGTQFGVAYYSATDAIRATGAGSGGQFLLGQSAAAPTFTTLSGDVQTVTSGGAVTLSKVNGIPFATSYTNHGVLIAQGSSQFASVGTANVGQCLLSQGSSADPIWSSCAAGTGSAGGSNTQVQFNNATSLGGSVNLTWVSPAMTIGVAGTTTGQLALAPAAGASGTVTVQNPNAVSAYNFNLPITAGSAGQPMISGGGGSTSMSFGTLGIFGGGTNCSSASGTCLDNITGFSSTGFVQRTGAGTYAFSNVITVSGGGTGLANGTSGGVPAFTGSTTMTSSGVLAQYSVVLGGGAGAVPATLTKGTAGQILVEQTGANPAWSTMGGDATINSSAALTIANSAVSNAKLANAAAFTFKGNVTSGSAAPTDFTPGSLTQKASPAAGDYIVLADNAAAGALKYATVSSIATAGSVASLGGATGAISLSAGLSMVTTTLTSSFGAQLLHVYEQQSATVAGGTCTTGAWRTRVINTTGTNEISGASIGSNQITLPAGTFYAQISAPAYYVGAHKAKLRNTTDASDTLIGTTEVSPGAPATDSSQTRSQIVGRFTIAGTKVYEVQHQCTTTEAGNGFGVPAGFSVPEVYTVVQIWKL